MSFHEYFWIKREYEKSQKLVESRIKHRGFLKGNKRKQLARKNKVRRVQQVC